jgi:hypothetical protein
VVSGIHKVFIETIVTIATHDWLNKMNGKQSCAIFYLSQSNNRFLLQELDHLPLGLEALERQLGDIFDSRGQLLKSLRRGEMLDLVKKKRDSNRCFQYEITEKGHIALMKYLEVRQILRSRKAY